LIDQPTRDRRKISARGQFILWEDDETYVVFDGRHPDSMVESFPHTEGGLLDAEAALRNLVRADRLATFRIVLIWGTVVGLVAWMFSSVLIGYLQIQRFTSFGGGPGSLITASFFVVTVSRAVWVGSLAGLVLMWLVRSGGRSDASVGG